MRNSMEVRLLKRLLSQGDGAALFLYLFATQWGYPPSVGTQAEVELQKSQRQPGVTLHWFNDAGSIEWEAAEEALAATKAVEAHVERNLGELLHPERMN